MTVIYVDMCGDIFHYGHVRFLEKAKQLGDILLVGIHSDKTIESYKRKPIFTMEERIEIVKANKWVTKVIEDAPLYITEEYINKHNIDLIAIPSNRTHEEIQKMCIIPYNKNILRFIEYTDEISTTKIIERIVNRFI